MSELKRNQIGFLVALINEFAQRFSLTDKQSFEYIYRYGGIEMYLKHYNILHTFSFADMVEDMTSDLISLVMEREGFSMPYDALRNPYSRLYFQSPGYVYSCISQANETK